MTLLGIATLIGISAVLLMWAGRGWVIQRFEQDRDWIRTSWLRFRPDPIDENKATFIFYGVFALILIALILVMPSAIFAIPLWLVLLMLPRILVEMLWTQRRRRIDQQLPAAISAMSNSMRAGLTLVQAMQRLADQAPEPIRTEFVVMSNRYAYGVNLEGSIREAKDRLRLPNFNLFASAMLLNREMGGDVSETLDRISISLDKLQQMRKTVEAHTSEGRTNIKVLLIAPVLLLLMMSSVDTDGVKMLFTTPQGYGVLLVAGLLIGTGIYMAGRITRSEV